MKRPRHCGLRRPPRRIHMLGARLPAPCITASPRGGLSHAVEDQVVARNARPHARPKFTAKQRGFGKREQTTAIFPASPADSRPSVPDCPVPGFLCAPISLCPDFSVPGFLCVMQSAMSSRSRSARRLKRSRSASPSATAWYLASSRSMTASLSSSENPLTQAQRLDIRLQDL